MEEISIRLEGIIARLGSTLDDIRKNRRLRMKMISPSKIEGKTGRQVHRSAC